MCLGNVGWILNQCTIDLGAISQVIVPVFDVSLKSGSFWERRTGQRPRCRSPPTWPHLCLPPPALSLPSCPPFPPRVCRVHTCRRRAQVRWLSDIHHPRVCLDLDNCYRHFSCRTCPCYSKGTLFMDSSVVGAELSRERYFTYTGGSTSGVLGE